MQKFWFIAGALLMAAALAWPLISRIGLGRLPGDIAWKGEGFSVYIPMASMILASVALTVALNLIPRLFK